MCALFNVDYSYPNNIKKAGPEGLNKKTSKFGLNMTEERAQGAVC
jgi:hypothetical protein